MQNPGYGDPTDAEPTGDERHADGTSPDDGIGPDETEPDAAVLDRDRRRADHWASELFDD